MFKSNKSSSTIEITLDSESEKDSEPISGRDSVRESAIEPTYKGDNILEGNALTSPCEATTKTGKPCKARSLVGGKYCSLHSDPDRAAELGSRGGRRRAIFNPDELQEFDAPKTAVDVLVFLGQTMVDVRGGRLDPKVAWVISHLGANFLRALELSVIEAKLAAVECRHAEISNANSKATMAPNPIYDKLFKKKMTDVKAQGGQDDESS